MDKPTGMFNRDIAPNRRAVLAPLTLDFYTLNMLKENRIGHKYEFPSAKEKVTLRQVITTVIFNLATGVWTFAKVPGKSRGRYKPMVLRTPEEVFEDNYCTIIPSYLPKIAKEIKVIEDSVTANDRKTALESINNIKKILAGSVSKHPQEVVDYVDKMESYGHLFQLPLYPKSKSRTRFRWLKTDYEKTRIRLKKGVSLIKYAKHFGNYGLKFVDTNESIPFSKISELKIKK